MIEKVEPYFHMLLFAFVVGVIVYVTAFGAPARPGPRITTTAIHFDNVSYGHVEKIRR
jgi:hypothetical protein